MIDLSEKIGLTAMILLVVLLIIVINFNFNDDTNLNNSSENSLIKSKNIINESLLNNTFNNSTNYGIFIQDITNNKTIIDLNSEDKYSSPITMNLLLNLAILNKYDANYKSNVSVYKNGEIINNTLYGDLIIVPKGNINFLEISSNSTTEIKNLSKQIKEYGINQLNGNIIVDSDNLNVNNLSVYVCPTLNGELANITISNESEGYVINNIVTVNYTVNDSIDVIHNGSTIILNGYISNNSKPIELNISINSSINIKNLFINALKDENIIINEVNINYDDMYKEILLKNNLIKGNLSNFKVNNSNVEIKNSTLFINMTFNSNASLPYDDFDRVAYLESKPLFEYMIKDIINFNKSKSEYNILLLDNNSKNYDNSLKNLNEFLYKNNIFNLTNVITKEDYHKSRLTPKVSNQLLKYLSTQKYFDKFYNNMSSVENNTIKMISYNSTYKNYNDSLLNQSILGYMDVKGSKIIFILYFNNVTISGDNESEISNNTFKLLKKVYEKYN